MTHPRHKTPVRALIAGSALGLAAALAIYGFGQNSQVGAILLNMAVFGAVIAYILQMASFLLLRRNLPSMERPYVSPLGVVGAGVATAIVSGHAGGAVSEFRLQQRRVGRRGVVRAGHRVFRVLCAKTAGFVAGGRVRPICAKTGVSNQSATRDRRCAGAKNVESKSE